MAFGSVTWEALVRTVDDRLVEGVGDITLKVGTPDCGLFSTNWLCSGATLLSLRLS